MEMTPQAKFQFWTGVFNPLKGNIGGDKKLSR
jgi:hypothetical protein